MYTYIHTYIYMYVIRSIWDISVLYKHFRLKLISHFLYYVILEILFSLVYIKSKLLNIYKQHCQTFFLYFLDVQKSWWKIENICKLNKNMYIYIFTVCLLISLLVISILFYICWNSCVSVSENLLNTNIFKLLRKAHFLGGFNYIVQHYVLLKAKTSYLVYFKFS